MSAAAERDLSALYAHLAGLNPHAAELYLARLSTKMHKLAQLGLSGAPRDWIFPGLRAFPFQSHCIYFRMTDQEMLVSRVLHGSQDAASQHFPDFLTVSSA